MMKVTFWDVQPNNDRNFFDNLTRLEKPSVSNKQVESEINIENIYIKKNMTTKV